MAYRAVKHLRIDGKTLSPGASVPVEDGRDYGQLVRHGIIEEVVGNEPASEAKGATVDLGDMTRDELKAFAEAQGVADAIDMRLNKADLRDAIAAAIAV